MPVATSATRIPEREYFDLVLAGIEAARRQVWVAMFIYDIRPGRDIAGHVMTLSLALSARRHAGVDVRVLTAGQLFTVDIAAANLASGAFLTRGSQAPRSVPARLMAHDASNRAGTTGGFSSVVSPRFVAIPRPDPG